MRDFGGFLRPHHPQHHAIAVPPGSHGSAALSHQQLVANHCWWLCKYSLKNFSEPHVAKGSLFPLLIKLREKNIIFCHGNWCSGFQGFLARMLWFSNLLLPVRCLLPSGALLWKAAFEPQWHYTLFHTKNEIREWHLSRWESNITYCVNRNDAETGDFATYFLLPPGEHIDT